MSKTLYARVREKEMIDYQRLARLGIHDVKGNDPSDFFFSSVFMFVYVFYRG